ncbi:MAG TPA: CoA transferase [Pseudonocardia sp.]|nr:CoA transferase [Pseudonocardia sp.]
MGCPVAAWARSGVVALTGDPDGPPLVPPGNGALVAGALGRRIAELTGGRVRVDGPALLAERAAFTGATRRGAVSVGGSCRLLPTADGLAAVSCARPDDPALLGALISAVLDPDDPWPALASWLRRHPGAELAERAGLLGLAAAPVGCATGPAVPEPLAARPVDGLLVVDFSALWAGPLCAQLLGLAGARVVKVETPTRPDGARLGDPGFYRLLHAGHRSVVLDPATAAGRRAMAALVQAADIVVEASRPRALARFGLDAEAAVAGGTTWVSITAYGREADRVGFGDDVAAAAGLVVWDARGRPAFCGDAMADPLTGLTAAACALTAPAGGGGRLWDVSMASVVAGTLVGHGQVHPEPSHIPVPAQAAHRGGSRWMVDTAEGSVPVAAPRRRPFPAGELKPAEMPDSR